MYSNSGTFTQAIAQAAVCQHVHIHQLTGAIDESACLLSIHTSVLIPRNKIV
jgi:hypothetical protein